MERARSGPGGAFSPPTELEASRGREARQFGVLESRKATGRPVVGDGWRRRWLASPLVGDAGRYAAGDRIRAGSR